MTTPRRSRQGLTSCPACGAHVHAAERPSLTVCPFCGANQRKPGARRALVGRGGLLAASLLAFGVGCGGGDEPEETTVEAEDTSGGEETGGNDAQDPPDAYPPEESEGPVDEPMYGVPPEKR